MLRIVILLLLAQSVTMERKLRMVNGMTVDIKDRPYQVAINVRYYPFIYAACHCGGVIISANYVLTAAHCVDSDDHTYVVRVGTSDCTWWGSVYSIRNKTLHCEYKKGVPPLNDIAILEMDTPIVFTDVVQPIEMAEEGLDLSNLYVQISGYGRTSFNGADSDQLMKVEETALSLAECLEYRSTVLPKTFCHIDRKHRWTTCLGDSGGPVTLVGSRRMLAGILSSGFSCEVNTVTTSSSIPEFRAWIRKKTKV